MTATVADARDQRPATSGREPVRRPPIVPLRRTALRADQRDRRLRDLLIAERIVLLYSPSGAGKTSLLEAGLRPELERRDFHVLPTVRVGHECERP